MVNPFFKNNGPFKYSEILKELSLNYEKNNENLNIINFLIFMNELVPFSKYFIELSQV